jgi:hypothetical protein
MNLINLDIITCVIDSDYLRCFWYNNVILRQLHIYHSRATLHHTFNTL